MTELHEKKLTIVADLQFRSEINRANVETICKFFESYLVDKRGFYDLWVEKDPQVITPFVADGNAVCQSVIRSGWDEIRTFWDPIHDGMTGVFNWILDDVIIGEDPNVIVTKSRSKIDVQTSAFWGGKDVKYEGKYLQIFKFEDGKIKSFEEYYDTALLNAVYS